MYELMPVGSLFDDNGAWHTTAVSKPSLVKAPVDVNECIMAT